MIVRVLYKVDSIEKHERHIGYETNEDGSPNRAKPVSAKLATVRMSVVVPDVHPQGQHLEHPNYQVWKSGIAGTQILNNIDEAVADTFRIGQEYFCEMSLAPVPEPSAPPA
jgi:hypothetical protein